jgi:predicted YcjX-like family ATPase
MAATKDVQDFDELYPGRFIKAGDLKGRDVTVTISKVHVEELEGTKKQSKGILSFRESPKELVLNRTNGECIKAMFGRRLTDWTGKRITIYPAKIESDLADLAIRVRGSPDLSADVTFMLSLARKRPRETTLKKTGGKANGKAAPPPEPVPEEADAEGILPDEPGAEG